MTRGGPIARISHDERGAIMVMFAVALPVILLFVAFVVDVANWWEHKRHLQMQADAAALAGGQLFAAPCDDSVDAAIRAEVLKYAGIGGSEYNAQVGGTPPERLHMAVNSRTWPLQSSPVDSTVVEGEPCAAGMVDVKLTETDVPWFFGIASALGIEGAEYINARARVSIMKVDQTKGGLPVGVPDSNPKQAKVQFVNEDTGSVLECPTLTGGLCEAELTRVGTFNGYTKWAVPTLEPIPVTVGSGVKNIGMRVIMSGSTTNFECGELLVSCYDATNGMLHMRGWSDQGPGPVAKSIGMLPGTCGDAYFVYLAEGTCRLGMSANVDFGTTDPASLGSKVTAVAGGKSYPLSHTTGPSATLTTALPGDNNDLTYTADTWGPNGNNIRITYVVAGLSTPLSVSVAGNDIAVNIATDAGGAATSTAAQVRDAVNGDPGASALVTAANASGNDGTGVVDGPLATLTAALAGENNDLTYTDDPGGPNGNNIRIAYVVAGLDTPLSVSVAGNDITVNIATDAGGAATSTAAQVRDAVNGDLGASALVTVSDATGNDGTGLVEVMPLTNLAGGDAMAFTGFAGGGDGLWTLPADQLIPVAAGTGPVPIELRWEQTIGTRDGQTCTNKNNNPCKGTFGTVQRPFSASDARTGPIRIANITAGGFPLTQHSLKQCNAGDDPKLCTYNLTVELGLVSGFEEATSVDSPVVALRVIGGSQNQSLDCDPWVDTMRDELIEGCRPTYAINDGTPCPKDVPTLWGSPQPWNCVAIKTGGREGQVTSGMNGRILDNVKPVSCTYPSRWREYWDTGAFVPDPKDPRITNLFMTPYGSFEGSGRTTVPIINFASFYVTGWTGQPGFPNPCQGNGIDEIIGDGDPAWIYGRFIKYVPTLSGTTGSEPCDFADFGSCTPVLTE